MSQRGIFDRVVATLHGAMLGDAHWRETRLLPLCPYLDLVPVRYATLEWWGVADDFLLSRRDSDE